MLLKVIPVWEILGRGDVMHSGWKRKQRKTGPKVGVRTRGARSVPQKWPQASDQTRRVGEEDLSTKHLEKENQSRDVEETKLQLFCLKWRRRRVRRSMERNLQLNFSSLQQQWDVCSSFTCRKGQGFKVTGSSAFWPQQGPRLMHG